MISVRSNADNTGDILNQGIEAIHIDAAGKAMPILPEYSDDTAAAAGGVPIGGLYRTGATPKCRVT